MARLKKKKTGGGGNRSNQRFHEQKLEITGVLLVGVSLLALVAIFYDGAGYIGVVLQNGLEYLFGRRGAIFPIVFTLVVGGLLLARRQSGIGSRRLAALTLLSGWALVVLHLLSPVALTNDNFRGARAGAGLIGHLATLVLLKCFGKIGMLIFLGVWLVIVFILVVDRPLIDLLRRCCKSGAAKTAPLLDTAATPEIKPGSEQSNVAYDHYQNVAVVSSEAAPVTAETAATKQPALTALRKLLKEKKAGQVAADVATDETAKNEVATVIKPQHKAGPYRLPDLNLVGPGNQLKKNARVVDQARQLEETLAHFGVQVRVLESHHGPVVTRYELQPAPGVKVSKIVNLTDDLALALAAKGLRLEAPIPGKAAIGVEVPNKETQIVTLREVLEAKSFWNSGKLSIGLGVDIAGEVVVADLSKMPHLLVAGSTGSGKSVCVNTMIMSILYKAFPDEVKFIMIDPKMVELSMYNGIPHLMAPVVTEAKKAAGVLHMVVTEMERRYKIFAEARVRELQKYNEQLTEGEPLPHIVVIIDELADLMMVAPVEVEDSICRLAQMARATGIHLVVATQRPSVDVITGLIKANIPSRIAFAVSSQIDSRTILDCVGAERLLGRGDMLFSPVGAMKPQRIQGALVTEKEIEAVIAHWKEQGEPEYQEQYINVPEKEKEDSVAVDEDELFWDAVRVVVENGQASASVLQRRLRVGYTRAARLVDMMEAKGLIGPYEGSKPREVYINARQLEELKNRSQAN
jgi:S-DNA-T family DNA segregation ATPase FtsK/SpoIIIE